MIVNYFTARLISRTVAPGLKSLRLIAKPGSLRRSIHSKDGQATIESAPSQVRLGLIKVFAVVVPFVYVGAVMSKYGAEFLEEWNIFVPEDDDD